MQKILVLIVLILSGCSSVSSPRPELTNAPLLEKGWGRIFITAGQLISNSSLVPNVDLKKKSQTGPIYINGQKVGSIAYKEYLAVDLLPGSYRVYWEPEEGKENFSSGKKVITLKAGDIRYFTCDQSAGVYPGRGWGFVSTLSSKFPWYGYLTERSSLDDKSRLVSYFKYFNTDNAPAKY
jgi:hypothetical protein